MTVIAQIPMVFSPERKYEKTLEEKITIPKQKADRDSIGFTALKTFLNIGYYLCATPFKVCRDQKDNLRLKTSKWNQILAFLVMLINITFRLFECRVMLSLSPKNARDWLPPDIFLVIYGYVNLGFHFTYWISLWRSSRILKLLKFAEASNYLPMETPRYLKPILRISPCVYWGLSVLTSLSCTLNGSDQFLGAEWNLTNWFNYFVILGREYLYLQDIAEPKPTCQLSHCPLSLFEMAIGVIMIVIVFVRHIVGFLEEFLIFALIVPAWTCSIGFRRRTEEMMRENATPGLVQWEIVKKTYNELKNLIGLVNDVIGLSVLAHTVLTLFYYSFHWDSALFTSDSIRRMRVILYFMTASGFYLIGADVCHQVGSVSKWLSKAGLEYEGRQPALPSSELSIMLFELQTNKVGISCGKFMLTYSMFASIAGIVMTYFIICIQYRMKQSGKIASTTFNL